MPRVLMAHSAGTSVETARMESGLFEAYRAIAMSLENVAALDQPEVTEANTEILANLFEVYLKKTKRAYSVLRESSAVGATGTECLHEGFLWAACGALSKMLTGELAIDDDYVSVSGWRGPIACARVVLDKPAERRSLLENLIRLLRRVVHDTTCCFSDASVDAIFGAIQAVVCGPASSSYITKEMEVEEWEDQHVTRKCNCDELKLCETQNLFELLWEAAEQFETRPNVAILAVEVLSATIRGHWADEIRPVTGRHEARVEVVLSRRGFRTKPGSSLVTHRETDCQRQLLTSGAFEGAQRDGHVVRGQGRRGEQRAVHARAGDGGCRRRGHDWVQGRGAGAEQGARVPPRQRGPLGVRPSSVRAAHRARP